MSVDFALDKDTHDLLIEGNNLLLVKDADQVEQNTKIRLRFFSGEWFLDTSQGIPFYENILIKNPNVPDVDNIIKAKIVDTLGAVEILAYDSSYNPTERKYDVSFKYRTIYGISELQISLFS